MLGSKHVGRCPVEGHVGAFEKARFARMPTDRRNSAVLNRSHMVTLYKGIGARPRHRPRTAAPSNRRASPVL